MEVSLHPRNAGRVNRKPLEITFVFVRGLPFGGQVDGHPPRQHHFVVDHGELVMDIVEKDLSAWFLIDAHASQAIC